MKDKSTYSMLINGSPVTTKESFPVINPASGEKIDEVPQADASAIQEALTSAQKAFGPWSQKSLSERRAIILKYADLLEKQKENLIDILISETGKPFENADYDFGMLTTCLRFFVEEADRIPQEVIPDPDDRFMHYTLRQPLGVVIGYLAWNFPLLNLGYKSGPVLASGCTAVIKPSSLTPLASLEAVKLLSHAGVPDGVVNVITSNDRSVTQPLLESTIPSMVTMIGSTQAGVKVMQQACTSVKHFSVELGGNAPVIVYPDADLADAVNKIVDLKFVNAGQVCVSPNRCFVHESIYESFIKLAAERTSRFTLGSGRDEGTLIGPMITDKARDWVIGLIDSAVKDGAKIVCGGKKPGRPSEGYFMEPTILRDVKTDMKVSREEIFGPVLPVIPFKDDDDEIALANDVPYGLAAYVFTKNLSTGLRAAKNIQAGSVCINEPFYAVQLPHGGLNQSGVGKDCSHYSLEEYLTLKRVSILI